MDVVLPQLVWVGKRCYRKNPVSSSFSDPTDSKSYDNQFSKQDKQPSGSYENDYEEEEDVCEAEPTTNIEQLGDGRFRTRMAIASEYFSTIIGRNGDSKRTIEKDTKTQLLIPKKGQSGDIVITGIHSKDVTSAFLRIRKVVSNARKRMPFTHFVSVPLATASFKERFLQFKKDVLQFSRGGIDEDLFQNPSKLHLTFGVLVLLTNDERDRTSRALQECKSLIQKDIIGPSPLQVEIKGIEYMNDDPEKVDVLYGRCVDASGRLQKLADFIVDTLESEGLLDRQYDRVKLHVTLMNSLFKVKDDTEDNVARSTFNAKPILENWKDFSFGTVVVETLHLSQRYSTSKSNGYYEASTIVALNEEM